jgi:DNA mismatch endonuclease (patch repair protein)
MSTVQRFHKDNGFVTTPLRSKMMSSIRAAETKPEQFLRKLIWNTGLRYRKNVKKLPGRPDIVFTKYKLAVFIDGDFWHGYNWQEKKERIKSNRDFWIPKIERNMQRDQENTAKLEQLGFKVLRFWEHEVKNDAYTCVIQIINKLKSKK